MRNYFPLADVERPRVLAHTRHKRVGSRSLRFEALECRLALSSDPVMLVPVLSGANFVDPLGPPQGVGYGTPQIAPHPSQSVQPPSPVPSPTYAAAPFPFARFQEAPTAYGLSGIFTETGLPHAYEDEQLLARGTDIGNDANVEPDVDSDPRSGPTRDKRPDPDDQGVWMGNEGGRQVQASVAHNTPTDQEELFTLLAEDALRSRTPALTAVDPAAVDAAFTNPLDYAPR